MNIIINLLLRVHGIIFNNGIKNFYFIYSLDINWNLQIYKIDSDDNDRLRTKFSEVLKHRKLIEPSYQMKIVIKQINNEIIYII